MPRGRWTRILAVGALVFLLVAGAFGAPAGAERAVTAQAVDDLVLRLMSMYSVPGAAVALIQHSRIVLAKGYGFRDSETQLPVTERTLFNIGSITKSFTSLGIAQLVDEGRLDLDRPVIQYVPELRLSEPVVTRTVTLRQLMSHTSGLPRHDDWLASVPTSRLDVIRDMVRIPVTAKPGERFQYCNQNFVLAGYVLERVTGQSWEAYTRAHIFAPLGMTAAAFGVLGLERAPDRAQPYRPDALLGATQVPWTSNGLQALQALGPAGSIDANIADMARYAQFQLGDGTVFGRQVVSARMLAELHRPEIAAGKGVLTQDIRYALGWQTAEYRGVQLVSHGGEITGFTAYITLVPSAGAGVVILANADSAELFAHALRLSLVEELVGMSTRRDLARELNAIYHFNPRYKWLAAERAWLRLWPILGISLLTILAAWRRGLRAPRQD